MLNQNSTFDAARRRSPVAGYLLQALGGTLILFGTGCSLFLAATYRTSAGRDIHLGLLLTLFIILVAAVTIPLGKYLYSRGKKMAAIPAEELLKRDSRAPVLYLRSFNDDAVTAQISKRDFDGNLYSDLKNDLATATEEELLANELWKIGPPVAVGRPGEKLPELGMARLYFTDQEWQDGVRDLMAKAQLVVLRAHDTPGTLFEVEMAAKYMDPKKLLLLISFELSDDLSINSATRKDGYAKFKDKADKILPHPLPEFYGQKVLGGSLSGMIWFDAEWNPKSFSFEATGRPLKEALAYVFKHY